VNIREYWATAAEYYDSYHDHRKEDVAFWAKIAARIGGPVLEIGCGTGRVGLEIARNGNHLFGVDQSEAILNVFRQKLMTESDAVRQRVKLYLGDMRTFELNQRFEFAIIPFRPLQHMLTLEDQNAALSNARRHLVTGGILGFDVLFPNFSSFDQPDGLERLEREWIDVERNRVRRFYIRHRVDRVNQVVYASCIYRIYKGADLTNTPPRPAEVLVEERSPLNLSYYTYPHLRLLLKMTHFELVEEYGSFAREPITAQKEMIILARAV
jgi:SAM-dependent methyltransferase